MSTTRVDFPEPRDAGEAGEQAERELDGDVLQVVRARAATTHTPLAVGSCRFVGTGCSRLPESHGPVIDVGVLHQLRRRALGDDLAAVDAGARAHVDDVIGREDRLAIVLDDEDGVAEVAEARRRLDEPRVVARVQADGGLVENVEDADERGADLRREANALALAARERRALRSSER